MSRPGAALEYDVAIVGAGVVGAAIARELSRFELRCVLLEAGPDVGAGTSKANTALLHTGFDAKPGTLESRLVRRGHALLGEYALRRSRRRPPQPISRPASNGAKAPDPANGELRTANRQEDDASLGTTLAPGIAKLVAGRREALGLSQRELAKRAGISHTVISRIEGGEHSPSPKTLERLAEALR